MFHYSLTETQYSILSSKQAIFFNIYSNPNTTEPLFAINAKLNVATHVWPVIINLHPVATQMIIDIKHLIVKVAVVQ